MKYILFIIINLLLAGLLVFPILKTESEKYNLITCQICGYKSLLKSGEICYVCFIGINDNFKEQEGYKTIDELVKTEQLYFFTEDNSFTLYRPKIYNDSGLKFRKDKNWKPLITKDEIEKNKI